MARTEVHGHTRQGEWWRKSDWTWRDLWPLIRRTPTGFVIAGRWRFRRAGTRQVVVRLTADTSAFEEAMQRASRMLSPE